MANKANITPIPKEEYKISTSDVIKYLQDQLGFSFACDFTRWVGVTQDRSYVRMRCVFAPKDILATTESRDYVDRVLADNAAGLVFKDTVIQELNKFGYPSNIKNLLQHPDALARLAQYGVFGDRLNELFQYAGLTYSQEAKCFMIYLRPERIIADMLADPATNKIDGTLAITEVTGTTSETIAWNVVIAKETAFDLASEISIDRIFNSK